MEIANTERLKLRTLEVKDKEAVMKFWGNDEVMKYCGGFSGDRRQIITVINNYRKLQDERSFSAFAVVLQENNEVIGACGYNYTENNIVIELIFHFAKAYWGKGYATEASEACIRYARENLNIEKIIASVDPRNGASRKALEKLGFQYKGMKWFEDTEQEELYYELIL